MLGLIILTVFALGRKALQDGRTPSDRLMDLTAGPFILLAMGIVLLFLVNRRVQEELIPQPLLAQPDAGATPSADDVLLPPR